MVPSAPRRRQKTVSAPSASKLPGRVGHFPVGFSHKPPRARAVASTPGAAQRGQRGCGQAKIWKVLALSMIL